MVLRIVFFALMALGLAGFGTVAWIVTRPPAPAANAAPRPPTKERVLSAARPVHAGSLLKPEDLAGKEIAIADEGAKDSSPDTPTALRALVGAMVRRTLVPGDIVRNSDVMRPGDHGFLAAVLQPGMRAVTIAVDNTTGTAGLIWPGDRVDLILTQTLSAPGLPVGKRVAAETVLSNIRVLAIDQQLIEGAAPAASDGQGRTVTLEVTQEQAERVSVANRLGRLSLSVRAADASRQPLVPVKGGETTWALDVSPALGAEAAPPPRNDVMHIFQGAQDSKEYRF